MTHICHIKEIKKIMIKFHILELQSVIHHLEEELEAALQIIISKIYHQETDLQFQKKILFRLIEQELILQDIQTAVIS